MLGYLRVPVGWAEILKRTFSSTNKDDVLAFAATLAYSFFFALFPALIFLFALASFFPLHDAMNQLQARAGSFVPNELMLLIKPQIQKLSNSNNGGLLTFGIVLTLFSASGGMTAVMDALNHAYDITEGRSWWKVRLLAVGLVIVLGIFTLISLALIMVGPAVAERVANVVGLGPAVVLAWKILEWPVAFLLVASAIGIVYYAAPDAEQDWVWITPGSFIATILWVLASLGFREYVHRIGANSYAATYGTLGGIMIALLWLYITGLVLLFGAELNAEIEHASPYGKNPGEKVPGQRRKIGIAAQRAWEEAQREARNEKAGAPGLQPAAARANCDVDRPTPAHPARPVARPRPARSPAAGPLHASRLILGAIVAGEFALEVWRRVRRLRA